MVRLKINVHERHSGIGYFTYSCMYTDIHALVRSLLLQRGKIVCGNKNLFTLLSSLILNLHLRERIQVKLETSARSI